MKSTFPATVTAEIAPRPVQTDVFDIATFDDWRRCHAPRVCQGDRDRMNLKEESAEDKPSGFHGDLKVPEHPLKEQYLS